jgi:hypothetical protein
MNTAKELKINFQHHHKTCLSDSCGRINSRLKPFKFDFGGRLYCGCSCSVSGPQLHCECHVGFIATSGSVDCGGTSEIQENPTGEGAMSNADRTAQTLRDYMSKAMQKVHIHLQEACECGLSGARVSARMRGEKRLRKRTGDTRKTTTLAKLATVCAIKLYTQEK